MGNVNIVVRGSFSSRNPGLLLPLALLILSSAWPALAEWTNVGIGIDYQKVTITMADGKKNNLFLTRMAVSNTNCIINSMIASNRVAGARERPSGMAARMEDALNYWGGEWGQRNDVVVAINGSFETTAPGGAVVSGGDIYDGWYAKRFSNFSGEAGFAWKFDRSYFIGVCPQTRPNQHTLTLGGVTQQFQGINTNRVTDQIIVYTPQYNNNTLTDATGTEVLVEMATPLFVLTPPGTVTGKIVQVRTNQGSTRIPFDHIVLSGAGTGATILRNFAQVGQTVQLAQNVILYNGPPGQLCNTNDHRNFDHTYGLAQGHFYYLKNSLVQTTDNSGMIIRAPRTFVGYNSNYVFFGVCDGRAPSTSVGMTSDEMGYFCLTNLAATDAVNMDGGGSSVMWVNGAIKNIPSDGSERAVVNGLMMVVVRPKTNSTVFAPGQSVRTIASSNFRLGPGTDYFSLMTLASGAQGTVVSHTVNGVRARSNMWWKCNFGGTNGWIAESSLAAPTNAPFIVTQPTNRIVPAGAATDFILSATGPNPLRYQWQKNLTNLTNGGHYSGCTNATLIISGADESDEAEYRCVVTNAYGISNSMTATLTVITLPTTPTATAATGVTSSNFTANWNSANDATGYRLDVSTNAGFANYISGYQNLDVGNVLNWNVTGLAGSTTHYYRVRAYNGDGASGNSGIINVTTTPTPLPPPTLGYLRQEGEIVFFWPTNYAGFALEYATNLPPASWTAAPPAPVIVGGLYYVTNNMSEAGRYYRLNQP